MWVEEIQLRPDGPTATMHLNLRDYPTTPPRKWEDRNCTTVHIELAAIGVTAIAIDRLGSIQAADLSISATHGGGRLVLVESDHTRIEIECDFAEVRSVSAH